MILASVFLVVFAGLFVAMAIAPMAIDAVGLDAKATKRLELSSQVVIGAQ